MIPTRYSIRKTPECRKTPTRTQVYVLPEVMTAIVAPALSFPGAAPNIAFDTPRRVAAAVAALVARRRQGVLWTVVLGMMTLSGLQAFMR